jgi:hypothetical protein
MSRSQALIVAMWMVAS